MKAPWHIVDSGADTAPAAQSGEVTTDEAERPWHAGPVSEELAFSDAQRSALYQAHVFFERNSGWSPPDPESLSDWVAEGLSRCPDDCVAPHDGWCEHGLASWWLVLRDLEANPAGRHILG